MESLARAADFDYEAAHFDFDDRENYGEVRYRAISFLDGRLFSIVFTEISSGIRVISLRKADKRDEVNYAEF